MTVLDDLPAEYPEDLTSRVREAVAASGRKLIALDDDPTGVQTVHDTAVLAQWGVEDLSAELRDPRPVCFILTNSRSLPEAAAAALNREIATNLVIASRRTGIPFAIASRSDSTLRGHFPAETDALTSILGNIDGILIVPAFFEGGRFTVGDVHWVRDGDALVPAADTEFARDATFGYTHSNLREWVEEKTGGRLAAPNVRSISIEDIRQGGPTRVSALLANAPEAKPIVINAASYRDLDVVALGVLAAEATGKCFIYRTGAAFVRARAGLSERPLLSRQELLGPNPAQHLPGLVVVGSHVLRTGEQLADLMTTPGMMSITLDVARILDPASRETEIRAAQAATEASLQRGQTAVIATSRAVARAPDPESQLEISRSVSSALVAVVAAIGRRPGWIVAKGGITSSDVGTVALGVHRAIVLGQIRPGIPVWRLGPESRFPDLPFVIFPGNVGGPTTLTEVVQLLQGD